ncbi:MAG: cation transporter [Erysipelotrichaceae bacterium]|nr:cation transporter [Erysipelotrichaceae bacterium]
MAKELTAETRDQVIVRTSVIGILANILLAAFKAVIGVLSHSIAVVLDAVNNLSDALSSVITIVGTKLAGKKPDTKHPLGYGRIEYLSALVVAAIVLYAGGTSLVESVKKIISPEKPDYSTLSLIIIASAVAVKLVLGNYVKNKGKSVNSGALVASGSDALFDAVLSSSVLLSALIFKFSGISLEAYVGVLIAVMIIKAGFEMMQETLDEILGTRPDKELSQEIKRLLKEEEGVRGAYDLIINNYGPDRNYASVHLELPDTMTVRELDELTRKAEAKVFRETGVVLTGVSVYSYNTKNDEAARIRDDISDVISEYDWAVQMHGFYLNQEQKVMRFDVVLNFGIEAREGIRILREKLKERYPDYTIQITPDVYVSD